MSYSKMSQEDVVFRKIEKLVYDPVKIGSIDGTDTEPHDRAIVRAIYSQYTPNKSLKGNPNNTIFVGRLNPRTTEDTLLTEFGKFGKILQCHIVRDIVTGKSKQYAFIEFENPNHADKAFKNMYKESIDGSQILVDMEVGRKLLCWKPRRMGGGFGGKKESGQLRFGCRDRPFRRPLPFIVKTEIKKEFLELKREKSEPSSS